MSKKKTLLISLLILAASAVITTFVFFTEPEAQREGATKKTAMLVDVVQVERGDYRPTVVATGTVQAAKDITLSPRVSGEIISISPNFTPGAFVKQGQVLFQIDPADYRNTLKLRESDLQLAKADLRVEMGRQDVAKKDYELIGDELSQENKELVLRKPQLESAKANVAAAEAAVQQARLALQRTTVKAPFDAHIISRNTNVGSQVAPGDNLGRLVGMEEYWVVANVPVAKVGWLSFSEEGNEGSDVKVVNDNIWPSNQYRKGRLFRLVGALDNQTRLARVLVSVSDPLARINKSDTIPRLMIGTFVEAHIEARVLKDVVRLSRDYLRKENTVWVMEEGKLKIKKIDILFQDADYAYLKGGLADDAMVVTTNLSTVVEGSGLRLEGENKDDTTSVEK